MKRVFIAGPYSSDTIVGSLDNMRRGMETAYHIRKAGFAVFCPWHDYHYSLSGPMTLDEYRENSLAWLEVSDFLFLLPGWEKSEGARAERDRAIALGIPVCGSAREIHQLATRCRANRAGEDGFPEYYRAGTGG